MRPNSRPFYPVQVPTGETYVVDNRTRKVASAIFCEFDMVERWRVAVIRADRLNDEFEARFFVRRRRFVVLALAIAAFVGWVLAMGLPIGQ